MNFLSSFRQWLEDMVYYFPYFPLIIQIAILVSLFAILGTLAAYIYLLSYRRIKERQLKRELPLREKANVLLLEHIIYKSVNNTGQPLDLSLQSFAVLPLKEPWAARVFIDQLLEYRKNFTGDIPVQLRRLYLDLGLQRDAVAALKSGNRKATIDALVELAGMGVLLERNYIMGLTHSKDRYVREMARCYMVQCAPDSPFEFLDHVEEPMQAWEQFELFRIISLRKDVVVPSFARWLHFSSHPSVISLCLKLATYYQQPEAIAPMVNLLSTSDETLRASVINSLGKLMAIEAEATLVAIYPEQPINCKMEILKALGRIGSGHYLDFLKQELEQSDEFLLIKHAAHSITAHQKLAAGLIRQLQQSLTGSRLLVLQHSLNPLIKY